MKKLWVIAVVVAVGILGTALYGWSQAAGPAGPAGQVDVKVFRQFQKETLPLRDELMAKRLELRNEYAQPTPNPEKIGALQKEMIDLRTKIHTTAQKLGLPQGAWRGWGGGKGGPGRGGCSGAGWGKGPAGGGCGYGFGGGPGRGHGNCPMWN